jgi:hypothetical protein
MSNSPVKDHSTHVRDSLDLNSFIQEALESS